MNHLCIDIIFSCPDFKISDGCFPESTSLGRFAFSPLKELEPHCNLFQYGYVQVQLNWESRHLDIQNPDGKRYYRCTDDAQRRPNASDSLVGNLRS